MCLGIPGKVIDIFDMDGTLMSTVDFDGVTQKVCIATVPEVKLGQYVIVHAGFALNVLSETEAEETIFLLSQLAEFNQNKQDQSDS